MPASRLYIGGYTLKRSRGRRAELSQRDYAIVAKCANLLVSRFSLAFCWKTINAHAVTEIHQAENWFAAGGRKNWTMRMMYDRLEQVIMSRSISRVYSRTADDIRARWRAVNRSLTLFRQRPRFHEDLCASALLYSPARASDSISSAARGSILQRRLFHELGSHEGIHARIEIVQGFPRRDVYSVIGKFWIIC